MCNTNLKTMMAAAIIGAGIFLPALGAAEEKSGAVSLQGRMSSDDSSDSLLLMSGFTSLVSQQAALDLVLMMNKTSGAGGADSEMLLMTGQGKYYFKPVGEVGSFVPYVFAGFTLGSTTSTVTQILPFSGTVITYDEIVTLTGLSYGAGFELFMRENVSMPLELRMSSLEGGNITIDQTEFTVGLKVYF